MGGYPVKVWVKAMQHGRPAVCFHFDLPEGSRVHELAEQVLATGLSENPAGIYVNGAFAPGEQVLCEGDQVRIFPAFYGG